jgi:prepilin-type N-terminal cleavage/methylation domain-containing protein
MKKINGFTLIELSVVLFIVSLLMVGLLGPVATQIEARERQQTIDTMNNIMESLYGFAIINRYLPCPDTDGDGLENGTVTPGTGTCPAATGDGWLPWRTLGLSIQGDVWGNRFKYQVNTPDYTTIDDGICGDGTGGTISDLDLCQPTAAAAAITINTRGDNPVTLATIESKFSFSMTTRAAAVVVSHGRNSLGATTVLGVTLTATTAGTDENENDDANTNTNFYSRTFSEGAAGCTDDNNEANFLCAYDDIVMWISPNILMNRMIKAEVLP